MSKFFINRPIVAMVISLAMQVGRLAAKKIRAGGTLLFPALRSTKFEAPARSAH
jgi:hypothetical protein